MNSKKAAGRISSAVTMPDEVAILAAFRPTIHLSRCAVFPSHLSQANLGRH